MKLPGNFLCMVLVLASGQRPAERQVPYFDFQVSFWMNLHQTLFREAVLGKMPPERQKQAGIAPLATDSLSPGEKQDWNKAIQFYAETFSDRRLLFDEGLVRINNALASFTDTATPGPRTDLPPGLIVALESAAPVYRGRWWPAHKKADDEWVESMRPRVEEMAPHIVTRLEQLLQEKYPSAPDRFDVAYYVAEVGGAYTTENPGHTTMASSRVEISGLEGLETVFHEGTHLITSHLQDALDNECKLQKKDCGVLWHAVQFFTVGEVFKAELASRGTNNFTPYAYKFGLWERGPFKGFRPAIEKNWQPYMQGKASFGEAIKSLVADIH